MDIALVVLVWAGRNLLIPLLCSLYASLIVVRYVDFVQMKEAAGRIASEAHTHFLSLAMLGRDHYRDEHPVPQGTPQPLLKFGGLVGIRSAMEAKGHKRAASVLEQLEVSMLFELRNIQKTGKHTEDELVARFFCAESPESQISSLRPSIWSLLTILRWNL